MATNLVTGLAEGFGATAAVLSDIHDDIGWLRINEHLPTVLGQPIYTQERKRGAWRIKKVQSGALVGMASSTDAANSGVTEAQAWTNRLTLGYV